MESTVDVDEWQWQERENVCHIVMLDVHWQIFATSGRRPQDWKEN
jgi:hypothetical protein